MGYNVGGIVGRQSGYLDGCRNTGTVRGRKDVGGIAGQLEPQVTLRYDETDQMGVIHHANYILYFEDARTAFLE